MSQARAGPSRPRSGPAANALDPFGRAPMAPASIPPLRRPPRPRRPSPRATGPGSSKAASSSRIAAASERMSAVMARLFRRHGASISRHPIRTLLLCCLFITSLFYPAAGIYLFASQGGPGLSRSDTTSVWRTLSTPLLDSFASSGRTHLNSLRDLRMVWDDAPDLSAKDPRDTIVERGGGRQPAEPQCVRLEHVLVTTDDVMRGAAGRGGVLQAAVLNSAQRLQAALEARLAGEAAEGTAQPPRCVRTPAGQCLTLSPLDYWKAAALPLQPDVPLSALLEPQHNVSSRGVPLALTTTLAGRGPLFSRNPRAEFLVLSFWLQDEACGANGGEHEAFGGLLNDVASGTRIVQSELRFEKEVMLRFVPDAAVPKLRKVLLGLGYLAFVAWIALGLVKVRKVHSPWGLAFTGTIELLISTIMSVSICALSGLRLAAVPWEILPFVIVLVGSENMFFLTDAIVSTPLSLSVPARIGAGLNAAGVPIAVTVLSDVLLMALIATVVHVPAVREFCLFAICSLVVDFFMQMTFFVTVLSIDLQRLELADLLAQGGRGQAETVATSESATQDDLAIDSSDEDTDAPRQPNGRAARSSSGRSARTDSYLKMSCKAAWRARTARTATLSGLLAALFGLYVYYGTGYQAEGVHGPTLPFAEAYPSSSVYGSQELRPSSTHLPSQTFDPLAHLPDDAEQNAQQPWWQSSPSAPFWQALNPRGVPHVRITVAPWTIVSLRASTSVGAEHARPVAFAAWALFRPRVRALIWFFKLSVLPIAGTTGLLWVLLLYLLKDTELLYAQEDKEDAMFDDSASDRGVGNSDGEDVPPLKVQLTTARALHGSDVDFVAQDGETALSVAIDSSISLWRVGGPTRSVAGLRQTPSPGSATSARAPQATCAAVNEAADRAAVGYRSGAISVLSLSGLSVVASVTATTSPVQHLCFVPRSDKDPPQLISAHRDGSAYVWPVEDGASPREVVAPRSQANWTSYAVPLAAAFSDNLQQPDLLAFASSSSSLELRHWKSGRLDNVFTLDGAPRALYRCVALSSLHFATSNDSPVATPQPASRSSEPLVGTVLCGTLTGVVQAWDLTSAQLIASLELNDGAILSLHVLPTSHAGSAPSDVALACTATSAFLLRLGGTPHSASASELGPLPGRPSVGLTLSSSPPVSRAGLPNVSGVRRLSDASSVMMTPSSSGRVRSDSRPSSAGTGSLNAAGHVVGTDSASTGVAPSPRNSRFRTSTDRASLEMLEVMRDGSLPDEGPLRATRRESIKRGGAVLARDERGDLVVLGVGRRQTEDASRWELWHLQNAGTAASSGSGLETSLLELEGQDTAHETGPATASSPAPAWPSPPLRPTHSSNGLFAMPLSFTRIKPVLLSTRGASSSTSAPRDAPPALLLGFGNSLAHVVPLRQSASVVTLPDNSRASSELAGAQHMRRRGGRRPSDYGI